MTGTEFLPVSREEMRQRDWYYYDFLMVTADAYIDHPSFGTTLIARVLEDEGFRVAILAQPEWKDCQAFAAMGKPRYGVLIGGGNLDSMVAHYTGPGHHRLRQPGPGSLWGHPHHHRRSGGIIAPVRPLRLLGRRRPTQHSL